MKIFNAKITHILICLQLCLLTGYAVSQSYLAHTYAENDGLSNSMVYDVAQDSSGRMWFATRSGISVYDGFQWKSYTIADGLPVLSYSKIEIDEKGTIWVLSKLAGSYLSCFDGNEWISLPKPDNLTHSGESGILKAAFLNNQRYIAVADDTAGIFLYTADKWKHLTQNEGLLSNYVNGIAVWKGMFYVATNRGLSIVKGGAVDNSLNERINLPSNEIVGIEIESDEKASAGNFKIWLHGGTWVGFIENGEFHLLSDSIEIDHSNIRFRYLVLQPDFRGGLYFGNPSNLKHIKGNTAEVVNLGTENGLRSEGATSLFIDREKNLWITSLRGVSKIPSMRFANYRKANGLLADEVTAILEISPGKFVFGHNNGLTYFDGNRFRIKNFEKETYITGAKNSRILDLGIDSKKNLWLAAAQLGLAKIDKNGDIKWYGKKEGLKATVNSVLVDHAERVWAAAADGLHLLKGESFFYVGSNKLTQRHIRKIFQGPDDSIYMATPKDGIYVYKQNKWQQYIDPDEPAANNVYSILCDTQGRILVGTLAGLYQVKNDALVKADLNNFKISRPIYVMVEDNKQRIWFGTDNGVIRWDGKQCREYTVKQGFAGQETNRAAGIIDSQGRVWIGTDLGVSCYQQEFDSGPHTVAPPLVELLYLEASGERHQLDRVNKLSYNQNNFIFHFRGISFIDEKSNRIRSKLEGFDKDWSTQYQSNNQQIRYTNLSPGNYRFHVQVRNALGAWSAIKSSKPIIIRNPYWKQWWFYLFCLFVAGLIAYGILRFLAEMRYSSKLEGEVRLRTSRLEASEKQLQKQNSTLIRLSKSKALAAGELKAVLKDITEAAAHTLAVERVSVWFYNEERSKIKCSDLYEKSPDRHSEDSELASADYPSYFKALTAERTIAVQDARTDPRTNEFSEFYLVPHGITSMLDSQIRIRGEAVGIICHEHVGAPRKWTPEELIFASSMADFVSLAIEASDRKRAEELIKAALEEKEVLLREIHHRVKNNLQVISSLLNLQAGHIKDKQTLSMFKESQNRVKSMALIHEKLYQSRNMAGINFDGYVRSLTRHLLGSYNTTSGPVRLDINIKNVFLDINTAIPCGLIINELVSNSLKHAFPGDRMGEILIKLYLDKDRLPILVVKDNGIGLPEHLDLKHSKTLGLQLISTLVQQLNGTIEIDRNHGTTYEIHFGKPAYLKS